MKIINLKLSLLSVLVIMGLVLTPRFIAPTSIYTPTPIVDDHWIHACGEASLTVLPGDTLDSISLNYAIPKKNIMDYNHMDTDEVFPDMVLLIPLCRLRPTVTPVK